MGKHLSESDSAIVEGLAKKEGAVPLGIMKEVAKIRKKKKQAPMSESCIRRILWGEAYQRGKVEKRRRKKKKATKTLVNKFEKSRKRLLMKAKSKYRVTYNMVAKHAHIDKKISVRPLRPAVRAILGFPN